MRSSWRTRNNFGDQWGFKSGTKKENSLLVNVLYMTDELYRSNMSSHVISLLLEWSPAFRSSSSFSSSSLILRIPRQLPLAFQQDPFGFSQKEKGFKPKSSWEKPKGTDWKAKRRGKERRKERGKERTRSWRAIQQRSNMRTVSAVDSPLVPDLQAYYFVI